MEIQSQSVISDERALDLELLSGALGYCGRSTTTETDTTVHQVDREYDFLASVTCFEHNDGDEGKTQFYMLNYGALK